MTWNHYIPLSDLAKTLVSIPAVLFILAGVLGLAVASYGFKGTLGVLQYSLGIKHRHGGRALELRTLGVYFGVMGLVGFLVGGVILLSRLEDPTKLFSGIAVALHALLYGNVLGLFCWVLAGSDGLIKASESKPSLPVELGTVD